jgi:hypothetical protein
MTSALGVLVVALAVVGLWALYLLVALVVLRMLVDSTPEPDGEAAPGQEQRPTDHDLPRAA